MLTDFYVAFATVCFTLLGLWIVVVQTRHGEWRQSAIHRRRAYGVALHFSLPGLSAAAYGAAVVLYVLIALVAVVPGLVADIGVLARPLRVEAVLLTILVFLGVNVAWLLLFDQAPPPPAVEDPTRPRT